MMKKNGTHYSALFLLCEPAGVSIGPRPSCRAEVTTNLFETIMSDAFVHWGIIGANATPAPTLTRPNLTLSPTRPPPLTSYLAPTLPKKRVPH